MDVAKAPVVVLLADTEVLLRRCLLLEPRHEVSGLGRLNRRLPAQGRRPLPVSRSASRSITCSAIVPVPVIHRSRALPVRFRRACARSGGIVRARRQLGLIRGGEREAVCRTRPPRDASGLRARAYRSSASTRTCRATGSRARLQHPQVELEAVHQGQGQRMVDLLVNRPGLRIDGRQA